MTENSVAKWLKGIGIVIIIAGVFTFAVIAGEIESAAVFFGGLVGFFIIGMLFVGFSEVINLLQENVDKQDIIIETLKNHSKENDDVDDDIYETV